ncbi:Leucine-rich_repeat domain superfamily [Hexamita inflata]|uniref:Leucine-rich repeat domain superfamily n=1 Tax=Hexamita inflata TaxID=28002 RepID=A0AA86R2Q6_9EUKA|nr:Leucine-rich repeat domain superfamily [Hexamita inflata]
MKAQLDGKVTLNGVNPSEFEGNFISHINIQFLQSVLSTDLDILTTIIQNARLSLYLNELEPQCIIRIARYIKTEIVFIQSSSLSEELFTFLLQKTNCDSYQLSNCIISNNFATQLKQVKQLSLYNSKINEAQLEELASSIKNLELVQSISRPCHINSIKLNQLQISLARLSFTIFSFENLQSLSLKNCKLYDQSLKSVKFYGQSLDLEGNFITSSGLKRINFKNLQTLNLSKNKIDLSGYLKIASSSDLCVTDLSENIIEAEDLEENSNIKVDKNFIANRDHQLVDITAPIITIVQLQYPKASELQLKIQSEIMYNQRAFKMFQYALTTPPLIAKTITDPLFVFTEDYEEYISCIQFGPCCEAKFTTRVPQINLSFVKVLTINYKLLSQLLICPKILIIENYVDNGPLEVKADIIYLKNYNGMQVSNTTCKALFTEESVFTEITALQQFKFSDFTYGQLLYAINTVIPINNDEELSDEPRESTIQLNSLGISNIKKDALTELINKQRQKRINNVQNETSTVNAAKSKLLSEKFTNKPHQSLFLGKSISKQITQNLMIKQLNHTQEVQKDKQEDMQIQELNYQPQSSKLMEQNLKQISQQTNVQNNKEQQNAKQEELQKEIPRSTNQMEQNNEQKPKIEKEEETNDKQVDILQLNQQIQKQNTEDTKTEILNLFDESNIIQHQEVQITSAQNSTKQNQLILTPVVIPTKPKQNNLIYQLQNKSQKLFEDFNIIPMKEETYEKPPNVKTAMDIMSQFSIVKKYCHYSPEPLTTDRNVSSPELITAVNQDIQLSPILTDKNEIHHQLVFEKEQVNEMQMLKEQENIQPTHESYQCEEQCRDNQDIKLSPFLTQENKVQQINNEEKSDQQAFEMKEDLTIQNPIEQVQENENDDLDLDYIRHQMSIMPKVNIEHIDFAQLNEEDITTQKDTELVQKSMQTTEKLSLKQSAQIQTDFERLTPINMETLFQNTSRKSNRNQLVQKLSKLTEPQKQKVNFQNGNANLKMKQEKDLIFNVNCKGSINMQDLTPVFIL